VSAWKISYDASGGEGVAQTVRVPSYGGGDLAKSLYNFYSDFTVPLALFTVFEG